MTDTGNDEGLSPLYEEYQNAKERLNQQVSTLRSFADEGHRMLRVTLVFVGLLITAASALGPEVAQVTFGSSKCGIGLFFGYCMKVRTLTIIAGIGLAVSAVAHGTVGNEARGIGNYGTPDDIDDALAMDYPHEDEFIIKRLENYQQRITRNDRIISLLEESLAIGKIGLMISISALAAAALALSTGPISPYIFHLVLLLVLIGLGLYGRLMPDEYMREEALFGLNPIYRLIFITGKTGSNHNDLARPKDSDSDTKQKSEQENNEGPRSDANEEIPERSE